MSIPFYMLLCCLLVGFPLQDDPYKDKRETLVKHINRRGIKDESVLKAMRSVKRHLFVPPNLVERAYEDRPLAIGYGQTISQPYVVAYMTEVVKPQPHFKALEIGTGSGYQAAVLGEIIKDVYTIEIVPQLGNTATKRLSDLGYKNITVSVGDGYHGWKEHAPYDIIMVTAAAEYIPPPLIEQLKEGGKMVIPIGSPFMNQTLMLVEKKKGKPVTKSLLPVVFVPFTRKK